MRLSINGEIREKGGVQRERQEGDHHTHTHTHKGERDLNEWEGRQTKNIWVYRTRFKCLIDLLKNLSKHFDLTTYLPLFHKNF